MLDSTRPKQKIKTNQNVHNSKNPKSAFLGTSMRTHASMYAYINHAHEYMPRNIVLKKQQNNNQTKPSASNI